MQKTLLLFDIDGTLLLTGGVGKIAFETAFEEIFGVANSWKNLDPHGKTDPAIFDEVAQRELGRLLSDAEAEKLQHSYESFFESQIQTASHFTLMPGVPGLLEHLSQISDIFLSVATGNFEGAGRMKLRRGNIEHYFKTGGFGTNAKERLEIIRAAIINSELKTSERFNKKRIFVIGDTEYDINAAKAAGVRSIAVLTNGRTELCFKKNPPDYILKDLSNIPAFMTCLQ